MNYCPKCGTKVVGRFCIVCGTSTLERDNATYKVESGQTNDSGDTSEPVGHETASLHKVTRPSEIDGGTRLTGDSTDFVLPQGRARSLLAWETRFVMFAFLLSGIVGALLILIRHVSGVSDVSRFAVIVHSSQMLNMLLGMLAYFPVLAVVPLALFLLARTGQTPSVLGIGLPQFKRDVFPGLGIGAAAFGIECLILRPFIPLIQHHSALFNTVTVGNQPKYYVFEGIFISAVTALTEEVLVNGYLLTRLHQLGWSPRSSLLLSLLLRTSYHVYYGLGFILTIPFGYLVTRSFQKHHRLNRPIVAHFLFDAILISIAVLK